MTAYQDEFEIARIRVGVTTDRELNRHLQPLDIKGPPGYRVQAGDMTLHFYTNQARSAILCAGCQGGVVRSVRLKRGFDGPLAELAQIPPEADSGCSLEVMGTTHGLHLGPKADDGMGLLRGRDRMLKVYGPPTREEDHTAVYDWLYGATPRRLTCRLEGDAVMDMLLELLDRTASAGRMRPLGPAQPFERIPPLPEPLRAQWRAGEEHLRQGRAEEAERLFTEVLNTLTEHDPDPHDVTLEAAARQILARASAGRAGPDEVSRLSRLLRHLESYASYNPPENLRMRLVLGQVCRLTGDPNARRELERLWGLLQASDYYAEPEVQDLVRRTAAELELAGEPRYMDEVRQFL